MITQPSSSIFWFFVLAACLFVGSRSMYPQAGCCCLSGKCTVPTATVPQQTDTIINEQIAQKQ